MNNKKNTQFRATSVFFYFGVAISFCPLLIFSYYFSGNISNSISDWGDWGQFVSGSVGALLSTLTIFLVVKSINLQTNEFNAMIQNQQETTKLLSLQNFENTFFNLIDLHHKVVMSVNGDISDKNYFGRDFFYHFVIYSRDEVKEIDFKKHIYNFSEKFSHYRLTVFEIFNFISNFAPIDNTDKYISIYKSQFSQTELITLCYLATNNNDEKIMELFNKYTLIDLISIENKEKLPDGIDPIAIEKYILLCQK